MVEKKGGWGEGNSAKYWLRSEKKIDGVPGRNQLTEFFSRSLLSLPILAHTPPWREALILFSDSFSMLEQRCASKRMLAGKI